MAVSFNWRKAIQIKGKFRFLAYSLLRIGKFGNN